MGERISPSQMVIAAATVVGVYVTGVYQGIFPNIFERSEREADPSATIAPVTSSNNDTLGVENDQDAVDLIVGTISNASAERTDETSPIRREPAPAYPLEMSPLADPSPQARDKLTSEALDASQDEVLLVEALDGPMGGILTAHSEGRVLVIFFPRGETNIGERDAARAQEFFAQQVVPLISSNPWGRLKRVSGCEPTEQTRICLGRSQSILPVLQDVGARHSRLSEWYAPSVERMGQDAFDFPGQSKDQVKALNRYLILWVD